MVEHFQKILAQGSRSQGARLLAALKDKGSSGKQTGTGAVPAYRGVGQGNLLLPFPPLEPPSPAAQSMPSRLDGARANRDADTTHGTRDPYELEDDVEDDQNRNPRTTSTPIPGVTVGKRNALCSSEAKKQAVLPTLFTREHKKLQTARLVPAGMTNLGNTCYLNSVIQVLLNMSSFTGDLQDAALERLAQHLPPMGLWAALRATAEKLRVAKQTRPNFESLKPAVEPSELRAAMGQRSRRWLTFAQQDAHEFLVELLEGLEDEVLTAEAASSGRNRMPLSETSCPTARNLSGSLMHTWTCIKCGHCTRAKEPFSCLSLPLPTHGTVDLQDLFFEYLKDETIYKNCDRCSPSAPLPHTAQHQFWRLPRVLVVHIKRFMPLRQLQQAQNRQATLGGDAALSVASATVPEVEAESGAQANAVNVSVTPLRDDSAIVRESTATVAGAPSTPQPAAMGSRESSPPAPYVYDKLHTVVKVTAGLDLATFCDAEARAHVHLLAGISAETPDIGAGGHGDGAAVVGSADAPSETQAAAAAGNGSAAVVAKALGTTTGGTLDSAGGGSTCPSPSFMEPNMSTLQERTVQQQGSVLLQRDQLRRSVVGGSKATTPGGLKLRALDSDCGTSAISTGAQANGGDGAPTPYGGCAAGIVNLQGSDRRQEERKGRTLSGSGGGLGEGAPELLPPNLDGRSEPHGAVLGKLEIGFVSSPHVSLRPAEKNLELFKYQATPAAVSKGGALSSHTCNDGMGPVAPPSGNMCRKVFVRKGGGGGTAASSDRKTPRPMGASSFFGKAAEACAGFTSGSAGHQSHADPLTRPQKRVCTEDLTEVPSGRPTAEPSQIAPAPVSAKQLEEMTEEEQLQLALQMSLVEETAAAAAPGEHDTTTSNGVGALQNSGVVGTASGAAAGSGPMQSGRREAGLDFSLPTAAPTGHLSHGGAGLDTAAANACTSGGPPAGAGHPNKGGAQHVGKGGNWAERDNDQSLMELQDESQGGYGSGHQGKAGQECPDGGRASSSDPALSGARGGRDDGHESEYSSGQTLPACSAQSIPPLAARLDRRCRRKRRGGKLFESDGVPEVAESPAVLPPRQKRREDGTHNGDEGRVHGGFPVAYHIGDEDDVTTALSPVSGIEKRKPMVGVGSCASSQKVGSLIGAVSELGSAPPDEDADLEAAKRRSLATYAEEERLRSSDGGTAPGKGTQSRKSEVDMEWERMLSIPDSNDAVGMTAEAAGAGCSTPKRGSACEASEVTNVQPPPPPSRHRRRSAPDGSAEVRPCVLAGMDEDSSRGGGINALVAAAGLHTGTTDPGAAVTDRRPKALKCQSSAGALPDDTMGTGCEQFKFGFPVPDAADKAGVGPFSTGGMGFGGAGSRREDPLDLTGGDEEDPDLAKAIMLSLQDVHQQKKATVDGAQKDLPDTVMDLAGLHLDSLDGCCPVEREPRKLKAKVVIVPDSDYEEDDSDGEGDKAGNGDLTSSEAGGSRVNANGIPATIRPRKRKDGSKSAASSVPLALVARYRLRGVVRHKGLTPFSGHYVADVLVSTPSDISGQPAQVWYEHNDAVVSHVDFARVREDASKQGYLFFFVHVPKALNSLAATVAAASAKPLPSTDEAGGGAPEAVV